MNMRLRMIPLAASVATAALALAQDPPPEPVKLLREHAGVSEVYLPDTFRVVGEPEGWTQFWSELGVSAPRPAPAWDKEIFVAVVRGRATTGVYALKITGVRKVPAGTDVAFAWSEPAKNPDDLPVLSGSLYAGAVIPRATGVVAFRAEGAKKGEPAGTFEVPPPPDPNAPAAADPGVDPGAEPDGGEGAPAKPAPPPVAWERPAGRPVLWLRRLPPAGREVMDFPASGTTFALYGDGRVLFRQSGKGWREARLDDAGIVDLVRPATEGKWAAASPASLAEIGGGPEAKDAEGWILGGTLDGKTAEFAVRDPDGAAKRAPDHAALGLFRALRERIAAFAPPNATPYDPEAFLVRAVPDPTGRGDARLWPADFHPLEVLNEPRPFTGDMAVKLRNYMATGQLVRGPSGAVKIVYRVLLPGFQE